MPRLCATTPDGYSREYPLGPGRTTIGRSSDCTIAIEQPTMSKVHAAVEVLEGRYVVVDLGSKNGVRIMGRAVSRATLEAGSKFRLGKVEFEFLDEAKPPPETK